MVTIAYFASNISIFNINLDTKILARCIPFSIIFPLVSWDDSLARSLHHIAARAKLSDRILRKTGNLRLARTGLPIIALLLTAICFSFIPAMNNYVAVLALMSLGNAFAFYRVHYFGQLLSILLLLTQEHIVELCISSLISRQS